LDRLAGIAAFVGVVEKGGFSAVAASSLRHGELTGIYARYGRVWV
jgi:hypothetical protein